MTAYMSSASTAKPATPPPSYQAKDTPRPEKKQTQETSTSESSAKSYLTETESEISQADSYAFAEMMASLLNMPSLAQTTPPPVGGSAANDIIVAAPANMTSAEAPSRPAVLFNMDPALLILPQDMSAAALTPPADGSFSAELIAALTPGVPAPVETSATSAVAVPVITSDVPTTPALTVDTSVEAEPRLIASGLNPVQLGELKEKISGAVNSSDEHPGSKTLVIPNTSQPAPVNSASDKGVITVTFQPPEIPASAATQSVAAGNVAVAVATQMSATQSAPVVSTIATTANASAETPIDMDAALLAAIEPGTEDTIATDTGFDPVEFRIAQRFQRPLSQQAAPPAEPALAPQAQQSGMTANTSVAAPQVDTGVKGKVSAQIENTASLQSSAIASTSSANNLTATPVALPVTVTPMTVASSPVAQSSYASQTHPAIQTVAAAIAKNAKESGPQTISMRLDPPELGKLQVEMKYKKGDPLKVHVVLEKADTATMFQKDAHALESALKDAGVQLDGSSLSFEFSQDNSAFRQAMGKESPSASSRAISETSITTELPSIETSMDIFTDNKTGLTHYNLRV